MSGEKYLNEQLECMPREELRKLQLERFKDLFGRARERSSFYRDFLEEHGAENVQINSLEDLQKIPMMGKKEARQAYPDKLVLVEREKLRQVHGTAGTTGKSTLTFATKRDLEMWAERNGRNFWAIGFRPGDMFLKIGGYGLASGAFGFHYGAHHIDLAVIPTGTGRAEQKLELLDDLHATGMGGSPSFIAYMAQLAFEAGMNFPEKPYPKIVLCGGQPTPAATRQKIESLFGTTVYDEYGMTELLGPGMACECEMREGLHVWSDHILVECVNPDTGEWVPDGEQGEIVWTFLVSEAVAMIRYRSGDLSRIIPELCACGRTHVRIASVKGRIDGGVSIGGFIVFASQVEDVLFRFEEAGSNFRCTVSSDGKGLDRLEIDLEVSNSSLLTDTNKSGAFTKRLKNSLSSVLGVTPKGMNLVETGSLPQATDEQSKTSDLRIVDMRGKD